MKTVHTLLTLMVLFVSTFEVFAEENYKVSVASILNVRNNPTTKSKIVGTLRSGQHIEVLEISKGWAKVKYNGKVGYVSEKYISPLPKPEPPIPEPKKEKPKEEKPVIASEPVNERFREIKSAGDHEVETPLSIGHSLSDNINLYLAIQGGFGYSNYIWSDGSVNGTISYSADIIGQLYFENKVRFIPANWYSELALGYDKKGAANYGMNYIHARIYPFGYRIPIDQINVVVKAGPTIGFALNDFDYRWSSDFQVGIGGGLQIEWKQFAIGCNVEYDFTEVSSSCGQTLNNIAVLGTISYKFAKFGHKR